RRRRKFCLQEDVTMLQRNIIHTPLDDDNFEAASVQDLPFERRSSVYRITGNISLHFTLASVSQDEGTRGFNDNQSQSLFSRLLRRTGHKRRARSTKYRGPSQTHCFEELCQPFLKSKARAHTS
ncbi:unnamed protein product, partial [Porites lobata]